MAVIFSLVTACKDHSVHDGLRHRDRNDKPMDEETFAEMARDFVRLRQVWKEQDFAWNWQWSEENYLRLEKVFRHSHKDYSEMLEWEFHILYEPSFQIPNLYFRVFRIDGSLLLNSSAILPEVKGNVISLEEHPFLPQEHFFLLHSCATPSILESIHHPNTLLAWFSSVSLQIDLSISPQQWQRFNEFLRS